MQRGPPRAPGNDGTFSMARGFHPAPGAKAEVHEAMNPNLSKAELLPLGSSRSVAVRAIVAARLDCPLGLMVTLAHDYHPDVRCAIASNPSAQRSVLAYLATDRHVEVVKGVVDNPSLPSDILDELSFHKKSHIREAAAHRLNALTAQERLESQARRGFEDARMPEMAEHVSPGSLAQLAVESPARSESQAGDSDAGRGPGAEDASVPGHTPSVEAYASLSRADDVESAARWTRTAPVRGFRLPG